MKKALIVTGTRQEPSELEAELVIGLLTTEIRWARLCGHELELFVGDARGVDTLAFNIASEMGISSHCFVANWATHGKGAGHLRNRELVDAALALVEGNQAAVTSYAFPHWESSPGTWDCVRYMNKVGLDPRVFPLGGPTPPKEGA